MGMGRNHANEDGRVEVTECRLSFESFFFFLGFGFGFSSVIRSRSNFVCRSCKKETIRVCCD